MATVGLKGFYTATYAENSGAINYTGGKKIVKAVEMQVNWNKAKAELYADNELDDAVEAITKGEFTLTPSDVFEEEVYPLLGITQTTVTINGQEVTAYTKNKSNEGAYSAVGFIVTARKSGTTRYKAVLYPKCKCYSPESESFKTQGENIEFSTATISGKAFADVLGNYVYELIFDTEAEAIEELETILGITSVVEESEEG